MLAYYSNYFQGLWDFTAGFGSDIQNTNFTTGGVIAAATAQAPNTADAALTAKQDPANTNAYAGAFVQNATEQAILTCFQNALQQLFSSQQYKDNTTGFVAEINTFSGGAAIKVDDTVDNMLLNVTSTDVTIGKAGGPVIKINSGGDISINAATTALGTYTGRCLPVFDMNGLFIGNIPIYN